MHLRVTLAVVSGLLYYLQPVWTTVFTHAVHIAGLCTCSAATAAASSLVHFTELQSAFVRLVYLPFSTKVKRDN